ncbi:MAG: PspA/IM30 family protein [Deltaproteobacteria bacterium]|nr:PspA/IM30 family protein [Deltaproteobacteria bacterium]MBW2384018.1 PspA/IM30 family protein [Deltaproteobacteria bacterium]MBW2697177.1 PspA/IM30 family protein [Deltaproteobacteria bacterium]
MRIIERLGLLVRADAHGVMDQLEERSLLVKQHLREAELELGRKRVQLEALDEEARRLADAMRIGERDVEKLDHDVELALGEGEEELARFAVRRLLPRRATLGALHERIAELAAARERLGERLQEQERELDDLRVRARARLAELERADEVDTRSERTVADEEVDLELLRRRTLRQAGERPNGMGA